jgi:CRP-like cAMP-binding protein
MSPLDSTDALGGIPLFASLGRVDLAKLAGELDECTYEPGDFIFHEGDPSDGLYIIRSGKAEVFSGGARPAGLVPVVLGPGECVGEGSFLRDAPRSASVAACTYVAAWHLKGERFLALLDTERPVARSVERALSLRLAATTRSQMSLQEQGWGLAQFALRALDTEAFRLMTLVAALPRWNGEALVQICQRTGYYSALEVLERPGVFIRQQGQEFVVSPLLLGATRSLPVPPDIEWLGVATEELESAGDYAGAVDLLLFLGNVDAAVNLLRRRHAELGGASYADRNLGWVSRLGDKYPNLAEDLRQGTAVDAPTGDNYAEYALHANRARTGRGGSRSTASPARRARLGSDRRIVPLRRRMVVATAYGPESSGTSGSLPVARWGAATRP